MKRKDIESKSNISLNNNEFVEEEQPLPKGKKDKHIQQNDEDIVIDMSDMRKKRQNERNKKLLKKILIILIIIAIGFLAYVLRDHWIYKLEGIFDKKPDVVVNEGKTETGKFPISVNNNSVNIIGELNGLIYTADDSKIYLYNTNGSVYNTLEHGLQTPVLSSAGNRILAFNSGGKTFKVFDKKQELYSKSVDSSILYGKIAKNGNVAIMTESEKYPSSMTVYDKNGTVIYRWSSANRIMNISFDKSGTGCFISTFTTENGIVKSVVHYIKFDSTEEKMTSKKLDTLVIDTLENSNGDIWAVGDDKFYKLDTDGNILLEYEYTDKMISYSINENAAAVTYKGYKSNCGTVAIFNADSDSDKPSVTNVDNGLPKK
ncbi:MAG: DUF5711 family protein, partial [Oscillospiraceae bacterium]